ncbi:LysR family transcriptional regulator [Actinoplanes sp. NPDC051494]|uniref:LysR family transcriptional regulator n=1 Tax=Actinoplanes sp. NPDC051494 TaxID=3363907 RepID=UPI0037AC1DC0
MELRNLRTFETVARTLSITRAAKELHYAQSSVSDQIQALERELEVDLLDRSRRGLRLTARGVTLAGYAERILTLAEEARCAVARPDAELVVGALETVGVWLLPAALADHRAAYPGVSVRLRQDNRGRLQQAVHRGDLDLCLTFGDPPATAALRSEVLATQPLVVIVPPAHRLATRGRAPLEDLAGEQFLATERGCGFREMLDGTFGAPAPVAEVSSIAALGACVAAGMGCALLPLVAVHAQAARGEVAVVTCEDTELSTALTMTWRVRDATNPTLTAFQDVLRARFAA